MFKVKEIVTMQPGQDPPEPQFLLAGHDMGKLSPRGFAIKNMKDIIDI